MNEVQTADTAPLKDDELTIESTNLEPSVEHKTGDRVTGTVVKVNSELHLAVEGKTYMLHFTTQETHKLQVNDRISGQLFVYENPDSVKRFGYVQLGTVRRV